MGEQNDDLSFSFFAVDDDQGSIHDYDTNIMGRFRCLNKKCPKSGWGSKMITITIRMYPNQQYNARVYHQRCKDCGCLSRPFLDDSYAERIAYRLKKWSGRKMPETDFGGSSDKPHESALCEGCKYRHCKKGYNGSDGVGQDKVTGWEGAGSGDGTFLSLRISLDVSGAILRFVFDDFYIDWVRLFIASWFGYSSNGRPRNMGYWWDDRMIFSFEHIDTVSMVFTFMASRAKTCTDNSEIVVISLDITIGISQLSLYCPLRPLASVGAHCYFSEFEYSVLAII